MAKELGTLIEKARKELSKLTGPVVLLILN